MSRIVAIPTFAVALAITGIGWYRVVTLELPAAIRWIDWRDASGQPTTCKTGDPHFTALIDGERLIVPCGDTYAEIDLRDATARMWPSDLRAPRESTIAIASGPHGELALAWSWSSERMFAATVDGGRTVVLGPGPIIAAAWVTGAFEIVQASPDRNEVAVTRLDRNVSRRGLPICRYCVAAGAYRAGDHGWVLFADQYEPTRQPRLFAERGSVEPGASPREFSEALVDVDRVAVGVIDVFSNQLLDRAGRIQRLDDDPPGFASMSGKTLRRVGGELARQRVWYDENRPTEAQETTAGLRFTMATRDGALVGISPYLLHAITPSADCSLWPAVWVPTGDGARLVSTDDGCYVELDASLEPRERVSLREHVATEGSRHREHTTPGAVWRLGFVLFGLFGCSLVFGAFAGIARTRVGVGILIGSMIYAVVAASFLPGLLPLLA